MSFKGKDCPFYDEETENNCHYSMFVRRKCKEGCCPDLNQWCEDAEVMEGRLLHGATLGRMGEWEERDIPTLEKVKGE